MKRADALTACEATVRRSDPDRYFASLFAPADKRSLLFALYALNHEVARASEAAREPLMSGVRLEWWRETLEDAREGRLRAHPAAVGLMEILSSGFVEMTELDALIEAREVESQPVPFSTVEAMESYAGATSAALMRIAAGLLGAAGRATELILQAGIAYGLAGLLRSIPFHATRGKLFLPLSFVAGESVTALDVLSQKQRPALKRVINRVRSRALEHFAQARHVAIPRSVLAAVLPAALVPAYLSRLVKSADPLRQAEISQLRRQVILLRAAMRQRL
ncbi:MAG TPA: squalene/phytoene synthase family protein [Rhizomicrobium sp.]|jgi:phytoene synthase|nr:squalene/phytoene synthase family protein [Rhizomicrobium sp.]